ncbi:AP endonuclease [Pseudomonas sp. Leaf58]|uniref:TIM barrel protein n=1 Tax=Pseudomonas sp. Leaf58 TaxID=1736226 RepID=UPI0006F9DCF5|nr:TIM barrel protein [Pseudomonas sp. Leaf58]AYG44975.1 AP endonuclease [Pseudomonas sp. Leaf58]KQN65116.1 AP endonuclease [Pseudomonas sp. Leaf58]
MHANPVSISLSSYGAEFVRQRGQEQFLDLLAAAGVTRVELREELFTRTPDAAALAAAIAARRLECLYSTPLELWTAQGVPAPQLVHKLETARALGAVALKVSLGHYQAGCDVAALAELLPAHGPLLLVENDQTAQGGRIEPLQQFFQRAEHLGLSLGMTFDIGNWQWQGEPAQHAARQLGRWVRYVHCKAVQRRADGRLAAVPPQAADLEDWAALMAEFSPGVVRAVEYPLVSDDLLALTRAHVHDLSRLGLCAIVSKEPSHA